MDTSSDSNSKGDRRSGKLTRRRFVELSSKGALAAYAGGFQLPALPQYRIAILSDQIESLDVPLTRQMLYQLQKEGFSADTINAVSLSAASDFNRKRFECLLLTDSPHFPATATANFNDFIHQGGDLVLLGGQSFKYPLCPLNGRWLSQNELDARLQTVPETVSLFHFDLQSLSIWKRSTNKPEHPSKAWLVVSSIGRSIRLDIRNIGQWQWDTFGTNLPQPIPGGDNLLCFWAKGGPKTPQLAVEMDERDGSRWIATIDLSTHWKRYVLLYSRFHFFPDASPKNRGGPGDYLHMDNVAHLSFGLATGLTRYNYGDNTIWISNVGCARVNLPAGFNFNQSPDLPLWGDYGFNELGGVRRVAVYRDQAIVHDLGAVEGHFDGVSAIGYGLADKSIFMPLLAAYDRYGRNAGWAAGLVINYAGPYQGSTWLFSGIRNPNFYRTSLFTHTLLAALKRMQAGDLAITAQHLRRRAQSTTPKLTTAAPPANFRISADHRQFIDAMGKPFVLNGCNYLGCENRFCQLDLSKLETDFARARDAGVNAFRIWIGGSDPDPVHRDAIRQCARKYGIALIFQLGDYRTDGDAVVAKTREVAQNWKDEPMVLGYDLGNEPQLGIIAPMQFGGKRSPLLELHPYQHYKSKIDLNWVEQMVKQRPAWPQIIGSPSQADLRDIYAAYWIFDRWSAAFTANGSDVTTFPGIKGTLPLDGEWQDFAVALNETFARWIHYVGGALHQADPHHFISVGYNTVLSCLPCNEALDFVSQHIYQAPDQFSDVMANLTTMDRLAQAWPDKPITLGEFGYSNGLQIGGRSLDIYTSALGEAIHYLYSLAHGHSGCLKWMLIDLPIPILKDNVGWIAPSSRLYEGRFGIYWCDGTPVGRLKPIGHALRFIREFQQSGKPPEKLQILPGSTLIGAVYRFQSPDALFIGDMRFATAGLDFHTLNGLPTNVMLMRSGRRIKLMATADTRLSIDPSQLELARGLSLKRVMGRCGSWRPIGHRIQIELLEGEAVYLV